MAQAKKKTTKRAPIVKEWIRPANDFSGGTLDIDYHYEYDCSASNCNDEGICRCGRIDNIWIEKVDLDFLVFEFARGMQGKRANIDLTKLKDKSAYYAIDRFIRLQDLDKESFDVQTTGGYYGDEIAGADMHLPTFTMICEYIENLKDMSVTDRIRQSLINEYGFLLEELEGKDFVCKAVKLKDVKRMNNTYAKKLDQKVVKSYHGHNLPLGVLLKTGNSYRLIDGYHRLSAAQNEGLKKAEFFVCEE